MKAWMVREVCKAESSCISCPLNAKYKVDKQRCLKVKDKYDDFPCYVTGFDLIDLLEDEEEY